MLTGAKAQFHNIIIYETTLRSYKHDDKGGVIPFLWHKTYLRYPEGTAYMSPFSARPGSLHCTPSFRTQKALRVDTKHTSSAQPVSIWHFHNAIAGLQQNTSMMSFAINLSSSSSQYLIKAYTIEILQTCIYFFLILISIKGYIHGKKILYN